MKRLLLLGFSVAFLAAVAVLGRPADKPAQGDDAVRAAAIKLFQSLTDEQKKLALKDLDDKDRYAEVFPPVERKGLPFTTLTADQKALIDDIVRAMTSEYGASRCLGGRQADRRRLSLSQFLSESPKRASRSHGGWRSTT